MPYKVPTEDLTWMMSHVRARKWRDVNERHLTRFYLLSGRNRDMAIAAIAGIMDGHPYHPMRQYIDSRHGFFSADEDPAIETVEADQSPSALSFRIRRG